MYDKRKDIEVLMTRKQWISAKKLVEEEVNRFPQDGEKWFVYGYVHLQLSYLNEAEKGLLNAVQYGNQRVDTYTALGQVALLKKEFSKAEEYIEMALKKESQNYDGLVLLYKLYKHQQKTNKEKLQILEKIVNQQYEAEMAYELAVLLKDTYQYEAARNHCKKLLRKYPNHDLQADIRQLYKQLRKDKASKNARSTLENRDHKETQPVKHELTGLQQLEQFIGLDNVKRQIREIVKQIEFYKQRKIKYGLDTEQSDRYHFVFTGNPGTGKTTIARIIGDILKENQLLEKGHLVETDRSGLVGEFIGSTAQRTKEKLEEAKGGVLFIDEAYALVKDPKDMKDFGRESVDTLIKAMEDQQGDLTIIMAGYKKEMDVLLESNPGLRSRINFFIDFPDYTDEELLQIAEVMVTKQNYKLSKQGKEAFLERVHELRVDETFGNARVVRNLIEEGIRKNACRLADTDFTKEEASTLEPIDFGIESNINRIQIMEESLKELDHLIGLQSVKQQVYELKNYIEYQLKRKEAGLKTSEIALHMMFLGNPGTGKTTVARILGKIFKSMGILKRGHFIEAGREDLVGKYVGQTAPKTKEIVKKALGGILFIDEAYTLDQGSGNDFGKEAIGTLIKEMEDHREQLIVILAGYPEQMEQLLDLNPGFKSRINHKLFFEDYTPDELYQIFQVMLQKEDYILSADIEEPMMKILQDLYQYRDESFGNGRVVRNLIERIRVKQATRVNQNQLSGRALQYITIADIKNSI